MIVKLYTIIFIIGLCTNVQSENALREYVVTKDMINGHKASQFSIYADQAEKKLHYRIKSFSSPMQKIDLCTYPKDDIIGKLDAHQLGTWYEARIEIKDTRNTTNTWFTGQIKRKFSWFNELYDIHLAERTLVFKKKSISSRFRFFNESKKLLALVKKRSNIFSSKITYDLKIFSNEFPDGIYLLAIAAYDRESNKPSTLAISIFLLLFHG
jgi:hypothetical protein